MVGDAAAGRAFDPASASASAGAPAAADASASSAGPAEPIRSDRPGSFPWSVLHERHPALLRRVLQATAYPPVQRAAIEALGVEISGTIEPLTDTAPDAATWSEWAAEYIGRSWFDVPFLWAENYFYRKLLAACGYLEAGAWQGIDPFGPLKDAELAGPEVDHELAALDGLSGLTADRRWNPLVLAALWGNRADLGFLVGSGGSAAAPGQQDQLVVDDRMLLRSLLTETATLQTAAWQQTGTRQRIVLVADNAGRELLSDLVLIDHLLAGGWPGGGRSGVATGASGGGPAVDVLLHVKPQPYFVSDATPADVLATLSRLAGGPAAATAIGNRLAGAIRDGRLSIRAHPFSVSPRTYHDMPADLHADFTPATLTIMKGDLNYRRLVGDRNWPVTASFAVLTRYFPSPVVALRTLKSDVVVGLSESTLTALDATGEPWRTNGRHALIQVRP